VSAEVDDVIRIERWARDGRIAYCDVRRNCFGVEYVQCSPEVLAQMFTALGFTKVPEPAQDARGCDLTGSEGETGSESVRGSERNSAGRNEGDA
jgi:hypothetical protein